MEYFKRQLYKKDFDEFCDKLNFEYDDGFGSQELFGIILFDDSYSDRDEYDGSERWKNHKMPTIKEVLTLTILEYEDKCFERKR